MQILSLSLSLSLSLFVTKEIDGKSVNKPSINGPYAAIHYGQSLIRYTTSLISSIRVLQARTQPMTKGGSVIFIKIN